MQLWWAEDENNRKYFYVSCIVTVIVMGIKLKFRCEKEQILFCFSLQNVRACEHGHSRTEK